MAEINLKNLADIPVVEPNNNTHLLVEQEGAYARVPKDKVGGSGGGLPEGNAPYQQLVTDGEGNTQWADRLVYLSDPEDVYFVPEQTTTFTYEYGLGAIANMGAVQFPDVNSSCTVTIDGVTHEDVVSAYPDSPTISYIGNPAVIGLADNGKPYLILSNAGIVQFIIIGESELASAEYTVSACAKMRRIVPLPYEYMAEMSKPLIISENYNVWTNDISERIHEAFKAGRVVNVLKPGSNNAYVRVLTCFYSETVGLWLFGVNHDTVYFISGDETNGFTYKYSKWTDVTSGA